MDEPSVELLERYRLGDEQAATQLFRRYVGRLTVLVRARMAPRIARRFDPEDVVLSAYRSFFVRARDGKFSLEQSGDLWRLLVGIVLKKLYHQVARNTADMRSVDREQPLPAGGDSAWSLMPMAARTPTAEQAVDMADLVEVFMGQLDPRSRRIFELRLQDRRIEEIATATGLNERTVRRTLDVIESRLRNMLQGTPDAQQPAAFGPTGQLDDLPGVAVSQSVDEPVESPTGASHGSESCFDRGSSEKGRGGKYLSDADFVLELHLGTGGTGRVYRARRKCDDHLVAIKMLRKASQRDPAAVARFFDEAKAVSLLNHPGIVKVQGIGRTRQGGYFLVHELVRGQSLEKVAAERPITVPEAARWIAEAAEALGHAHQKQVIHCDLKPANLLLDECGRIRVTDFGLAQIVAPGAASRTVIAGTFGYMAPEQFDPSWGEIGPHTDVFGLGAVLYSLLAGRAPFSGKTVGELFQSVLETVPELLLGEARCDLPMEFAQLICKCLALNLRDRFATAGELAQALQPFAIESSGPPRGIQ